MKLKLPALFLIVLLAHLVFILIGNDTLRVITKPMLLIILLAWYHFSNIQKHIAIYCALVFSLAGDILLMKSGQLFFIGGLCAFLLAHVFYSVYFIGLLKRNKAKVKWSPLLLLIIYISLMLYILIPHLGDLKIPVIIYSLVIGAMFFLAWNTGYHKILNAVLIITGAALFVASDSILAFTLFHTKYAAAPLLIMLTYGLAQYLIINAIIKASNRTVAVQHSVV